MLTYTCPTLAFRFRVSGKSEAKGNRCDYECCVSLKFASKRSTFEAFFSFRICQTLCRHRCGQDVSTRFDLIGKGRAAVRRLSFQVSICSLCLSVGHESGRQNGCQSLCQTTMAASFETRKITIQCSTSRKVEVLNGSFFSLSIRLLSAGSNRRTGLDLDKKQAQFRISFGG